MTDRKLRVAHIVIQPVLVWDDGDEMNPGPELPPATLSVSGVREFLEKLPGTIELISGRLLAAEAETADEPDPT